MFVVCVCVSLATEGNAKLDDDCDSESKRTGNTPEKNASSRGVSLFVIDSCPFFRLPVQTTTSNIRDWWMAPHKSQKVWIAGIGCVMLWCIFLFRCHRTVLQDTRRWSGHFLRMLSWFSFLMLLFFKETNCEPKLVHTNTHHENESPRNLTPVKCSPLGIRCPIWLSLFWDMLWHRHRVDDVRDGLHHDEWKQATWRGSSARSHTVERSCHWIDGFHSGSTRCGRSPPSGRTLAGSVRKHRRATVWGRRDTGCRGCIASFGVHSNHEHHMGSACDFIPATGRMPNIWMPPKDATFLFFLCVNLCNCFFFVCVFIWWFASIGCHAIGNMSISSPSTHPLQSLPYTGSVHSHSTALGVWYVCYEKHWFDLLGMLYSVCSAWWFHLTSLISFWISCLLKCVWIWNFDTLVCCRHTHWFVVCTLIHPNLLDDSPCDVAQSWILHVEVINLIALHSLTIIEIWY